MTKHTPATPLPWRVVDASVYSGKAKVCIAVEYPNGDSAAYIAHSANAYPKLVEALRGLMEQYVGDRSRENVIGPAGLAADNARSLLKSLGEE